MSEWRDIPNFPCFEINANGEVRNKKTGKLRTPFIQSNSLKVHIEAGENGRGTTLSVYKMLHDIFPELQGDGE